MKENDRVAAYFDKLPETHKRQFEERASSANFNFQQRLTLACELGGASSGRLLDCAAGTGEITCALLKSGKFNQRDRRRCFAGDVAERKGPSHFAN
jgi:ubiquinone/menaquinone biosynthesis C-methylase UbiE